MVFGGGYASVCGHSSIDGSGGGSGGGGGGGGGNCVCGLQSLFQSVVKCHNLFYLFYFR